MVQEKIPYIKHSKRMELSRTFDKNTSPAEYYDWQDNEPFDATIEIVNDCVGAHVYVVDVSTEVGYWMLAAYVIELIQLDVIRKSRVSGTWMVHRRGQSYSIKLVETERE